MGLLSTLRVKLVGDIAEYAEAMRSATSITDSAMGRIGAMSGGIERMGSSLGRIATVAAGVIVAQGFNMIAQGVANAGREALSAVADYERLGISLSTMVGRELMRNGVVKTSVLIGQQKNTLTEKEADLQDNLRFKVRELTNEIQKQNDHLGYNIGKGKLTQVEITDRRLAIEKLQRSLADTTEQLGKLDTKAGGSTPIWQTFTKQTLTMAEAQAAAGGRVQELLAWMQKLAIESPFTRTDVANAFRLALAYGFTTKQAQELTQNTLDFTAATGASGEVVQRVMLALGQIRGKGKVMGQELRQLSEAGFPANEILAEMGFTLDDVSNGLVDSQKFMDAFNKAMSRDFGGAAKQQATTFSGLVSSLTDLKDIALRTIFTPLFTAFKPLLDSLVTGLQSPAVLSAFTRLGEAIAKPLAAIRTFRVLLEQGIAPLSALRTVLGGLFGPGALTAFDTVMQGVKDVMTWITVNRPAIETALGAIAGIIAVVAGVFVVGQVYGAIVMIGGVIAAIGAPILILAAVVAAFGAIWVSDWQGIRTSLEQTWARVQPVFAAIGQWLEVNLPIAVAALVQFWNTTLWPALQTVGNWIAVTLIPTLGDIVLWLSIEIPKAIAYAVEWWNTKLLPALTDVWNWITLWLIPGIDSLAKRLSNDLAEASRGISQLWNEKILPALKAVERFMAVDVVNAWNTFKGVLAITNPQLLAFINNPLKELEKGFTLVRDIINEVARVWAALSLAFTQMKLPDWLVHHSPSEIEVALSNVRDTLKEIHGMGAPNWGTFTAPAYSAPGGNAGPGAPVGIGGGVKIESITIGKMDSGLDVYDVARTLGREVQRRIG